MVDNDQPSVGGQRRSFTAHDIVWLTDLDLNAQPIDFATGNHHPDVVSVEFADSVPDSAGTDELLLMRPMMRPDDEVVELRRLTSGDYVFTFGAHRVWIPSTLDRVVFLDLPGDGRMDAHVLLEGWVAALMIWLRGDLVLHASGVLVDDELTLFVGASGQGKSTMAATLCASGGLLVSDDVIRVRFVDSSRPTACAGTTGIRLRAEASEQAALVRTGPTHSVFDRTVVRPAQPAVVGSLPISRIVIPSVVEPVLVATPGGSDAPVPPPFGPFVERRQLSPMDALMAVLGYPRVFTWVAPTMRALEFDRVAALIQHVPIWRATVHRGPMDAGALRRQLSTFAGAE